MQQNQHSDNQPANNPAVEWFGIIHHNLRKLLIFTFAGGLIGVLIALLSAKEYTAWTTLVPQTNNPANKLSGISSLAAMAGFNLDLASGDELSPAIYPQIVGSAPFQLELMNQSFEIDGQDQTMSLYTYYTTIGRSLKDKIFEGKQETIPDRNQLKNKPIQLTRQEEKVRKRIEKQVTLNVDQKNGYITLYAAFPKPGLSAQVADHARELLQNYITEFRIRKANEQLRFIEERYHEKKDDYYTAQQNLARFRDQNRNLATALAAADEERLKGEYTVALSVYNELAKQLEQARIRVKEDTPVFSVIQPARVPNEKSKPKRTLIVVIWLTLGLVCGIGTVFIRSSLIKE